LDKVAAGEDITNTTLGDFMANELNSLGGMEKQEAQKVWTDLIIAGIQGYVSSTDNANSGDGKDQKGTNYTDNTIPGGNNGGGNGEDNLDLANVEKQALISGMKTTDQKSSDYAKVSS
jgi:hypothetical protein